METKDGGGGGGFINAVVDAALAKESVRIFSFLTIKDILSCAGTCRSFASASKDERLWASVDFSPFSPFAVNDKLIYHVLQAHHRAVRSLSLKSLTHLTPKVISAICETIPGVERLSFEGCSKFVTDEGLAALAATCGKSLRHIALDGCLLLTQQGLCAFLAQAPALETLSLSSLPFVNDDTLALISRCSSSLAHLRLNGCALITDAGVAAVAKARHKSLISLEVAYCHRVSDAGVAAVVRYCDNLRTLNLYGCFTLTDACVDYVARLPVLRELDLGMCGNVSDHGLVLLANYARTKHILDANHRQQQLAQLQQQQQQQQHSGHGPHESAHSSSSSSSSGGFGGGGVGGGGGFATVVTTSTSPSVASTSVASVSPSSSSSSSLSSSSASRVATPAAGAAGGVFAAGASAGAVAAAASTTAAATKPTFYVSISARIHQQQQQQQQHHPAAAGSGASSSTASSSSSSPHAHAHAHATPAISPSQSSSAPLSAAAAGAAAATSASASSSSSSPAASRRGSKASLLPPLPPMIGTSLERLNLCGLRGVTERGVLAVVREFVALRELGLHAVQLSDAALEELITTRTSVRRVYLGGRRHAALSSALALGRKFPTVAFSES